MANVHEGLEVGGQVVDPSTDAGFAAVLESRGVEKDKEGESTPSRNVAEGLSTVEPGTPARDPASGQFVSKEETAAAAAATSQEGAATSTEGDVYTSDDPQVAALLAKYGGDPEKALRAASDAQSLVGERNRELGEMREQIAELRGMVAAGAAAPAVAPLTQDQVETQAQTLTASLGYRDAATQAANSDERVYDVIIADWALSDSIQAQRFDLDFQLWKREQAASSAAPTKQGDGWSAQAEQQAKVAALTSDFAVIEGEYGGKENFAPVLGKLDAAMEQMPPNVLAMVDSLDSEARQSGLRIVADRAARLAVAEGAAPAKPVTPSTEEEQARVVARKLGGAVASSAGRPAGATAVATPQTKEEVIAAFKRDIVSTETTSVRDGLTYGKELPGFAPRT